jgi:hypothetical protein
MRGAAANSIIYGCFYFLFLFGSQGFPRIGSRIEKLDLKSHLISFARYTHFSGPESERSLMLGEWHNQKLGLNVYVGPSVKAPGLGLFVSVDDDHSHVEIEEGAQLCQCTEGTFCSDFHIKEDKAIEYAFDDVSSTRIIFNGEFLSLSNVINQIAKTKNVTIHGHNINLISNYDLAPSLNLSTQEKILIISPDESFQDIYYVPNYPKLVDYSNPHFLGMYANDLAFSGSVSEDNYRHDSNRVNSLFIAWEMELSNGCLKPTIPYCVFNKPLTFSNIKPIEIGNKYSWGYWEAHRRRNRRLF